MKIIGDRLSLRLFYSLFSKKERLMLVDCEGACQGCFYDGACETQRKLAGLKIRQYWLDFLRRESKWQ